MMSMKKIRSAFYAATAAATLVSGAALAQAGAGLVAVNLGPVVVQDIANDLNVNVSEIPVTVQAPIGVAANVCNVAANVLAQQRNTGDATCDAEQNSQALTRIVQRQLNQQ